VVDCWLLKLVFIEEHVTHREDLVRCWIEQFVGFLACCVAEHDAFGALWGVLCGSFLLGYEGVCGASEEVEVTCIDSVLEETLVW
jgi:hypothetical protein